jgi:hypothetical protein
MAVDGTWKVTIKGPMGPMQTTLIIKSEGGAFAGTQSGQGQSTQVTDGKVEGEGASQGQSISWSNQITTPMKMRLEYAGVLAGNEMSGKVKAGFMGTFPFTGVRAG